jgi:hypothetical protein
MDLAEIKQSSADLFNSAAAQAINETTPGLISQTVIALCESLNAEPPSYVPVQNDPHGLYGFCNDGVYEKIKAHGGTIRFGWTIWEYPGLFLTAEFHAVWVDPAGTLIDITPKPQGETRIVFAGDPTYPPEFDFDKRPNNRRARLYQPEPMDGLVRAKIARFSPTQATYETGRATKKSMTLEQWVQSKLAIDPLPDLLNSFLRDANEHDTLFVPGPNGMECSNPRRLFELEMSKMRHMMAIKGLIGK